MTSNTVFNDSSFWKAFEDNRITHSVAHYLMAIEKLLSDNGYARVTDVAGFLKITRGAASVALSQLKERGLIKEDPNRFLLLTEEGKLISGKINRNYFLLYRFFHTVLGTTSEQAREDACKAEHLLSGATSEALLQLLQVLYSEPDMLNRLMDLMKYGNRSCDSGNSCWQCQQFKECLKPNYAEAPSLV